MKRNNFIAATIAFATTPFLSFGKATLFVERKLKGFKISAGEGRKHGHIKLKGVNSNVLDVKISGSDTDGDLAIFEQTSLSQGKGTPMHIHHNQDEIFIVLEGSYLFEVGGERFQLAKGDSIFLPRKVAHAWSQISEKGKMQVIVQPAGKLEDFFISVAALNHEPSKDEMAQLFAANEMEVVGPPLQVD